MGNSKVTESPLKRGFIYKDLKAPQSLATSVKNSFNNFIGPQNFKWRKEDSRKIAKIFSWPDYQP